MNTVNLQHTPVLPAVLRVPFALLPKALNNRLLVESLNRLFAEELKADEFEFMSNKIMAIHIDDARLEFLFSYDHGQFITLHNPRKPDLVVSGNMYHFLLLASRREDPDTLFFNRQLRTSGDTELGLYV
ncbi:MAG: sterol-binding protein, partial [Gammaproteobacteria bacterium]